MKSVVITGGPCAGKTSALELLRRRCSQEGAPAVFVAEAATDLILRGVAPWTCETMLDFQTQVMALQVKREAEALETAGGLGRESSFDSNGASCADCADGTADADDVAGADGTVGANGVAGADGTVGANGVAGADGTAGAAIASGPDGTAPSSVDEVLVFFDRGICDSHAYLSDADYACALTANGLEEPAVLERYDMVIHLESVAKANPAAYTRTNNQARFENAEEAALADDRVIAAWSAHPHVVVIPYTEDFEEKVSRIERALETLV